MSRALRLALVAIIACVLQTNFVRYIRIAGVAPDILIVILVLAMRILVVGILVVALVVVLILILILVVHYNSLCGKD